MSFSIRKVVVAGALAAAALGFSAGAAQAEDTYVPNASFELTCNYPLVAKQPLRLDISSTIPNNVGIDVKQPAFKVRAAMAAGGDTSDLLTTLGAASIDGTATMTTSFRFPSGFIQKNIKVPLTIDRYTAPSPQVPPALIANGETPEVIFDELGEVGFDLDSFALNLSAYKADGTPIIIKTPVEDPTLPRPDSDGNPYTFDVYCQFVDPTVRSITKITVTPTVCVPVILPPGTPTGLKIDAKDGTSVDLSWNAVVTEPCGTPATGYKVYRDGVLIGTTNGSTSFRDTGLDVDSPHTYEVAATSQHGDGAKSAPLQYTPVVCSPTSAPWLKVFGLKAGPITNTTVSLAWQAVTYEAPCGGGPVTYRVYRNGAPVTPAQAETAFTDTGLTPNTQYVYEVAALVNGAELSKSDSVVVTTKADIEPPKTLSYGLKGSTTLKTLTTGKLPLSGGIVATADFAAGTFTADLTLNNTNGRLIAGGFLPITAKVGFVPIGKTTGTLDEATAETPAGITTNSKVRIKVLEVKLFGSIPLAGGNNCQTKTPSDITLKSTNKFEPFKGGTIAGTYKISDLNGCGALNGLVSPLTAGGGNTLSLDLTYKG